MKESDILQKQNIEDLRIKSFDQQKFVKLQIVIEDNGVGIKRENISKIFQDYSRLDEHESMNAKGTGLGMNICKRIIEQMGGKCSIDSEVDKGTEIKIQM